MPERWQDAGFGLYVHWPFCAAKCPYCDFNSHVSSQIDQGRWQEAYLAEIRRTAAETPGRVLRSVFFGGGTPSLMDPGLVDAILCEIRACWPLANDVEITLEANPTSVEAARFSEYHDAGVNRVSVGIQALNDDGLRQLGRLHSVAEARKALATAQSIYDRVSFDLIYARQHQTLGGWREELSEALSMASGHLSLYQLTIEHGTAFGERFARGRLPGLPDEDLAADMYDLTQSLCDEAGLPAYETSNHAAPGQEARHNLIYWRGGDYAGIGPGAHGRLTFGAARFATTTPLSPETWLMRVEAERSGESGRTVLDMREQEIERLMMGLRMTEGIAIDPQSDAVSFNKINGLIDIGLIEAAETSLRLTPKGRPLLNAVLRELLV